MSDQDKQSTTRRRSMLWEPVTGKQPEFDQEYFLMDKSGIYVGSLSKIETHASGKTFTFDVQGSDNPVTSITHYCLPVQP